MTSADLSRAQWKKSTRSSGNGQCVEVADLADAVALRDSKDPTGPALLFRREGWTSFLTSAKQGQFTHR
ncbi:DUF397 domain-containing protein [Micromonospora chokoriensis]|uniref:DUF397 domain-containing protein n=1 Tax=Micromonospora chokoriensis TaxID=356851 RepID=A0A1C4WN21_9ACTN|nr:DUF397 domain-containing protein [Micromonospora chokoriensis]SCE97592.1 protein of unknown function [Micromonospora chokoriensis]